LDNNLTLEQGERLTAAWQKWRFSAPQTVLWLIKVWFSASTFVVKIATFAKPQSVIGQCKKPTRKQHIWFCPTHKPTIRKTKRAKFPHRTVTVSK
jgi:hypothetical protein